jgi:1,2-dihydroxy-3-keto-5-methylthiopentene dioxygenase
MKIFWLDSGAEFSSSEFRSSQGVDARQLATLDPSTEFPHQDQVSLSLDTPNLKEIEASFAKEHLHSQDEVRYIVAGSGVFDIRSKEDVDAWIRIEVVAGDYIRIPANRYHRFMLTPEVFITAIRLFKDVSGWEPTYRE